MLNRVMQTWPFILGVAIGLHEAHRDIQLMREINETEFWFRSFAKLTRSVGSLHAELDHAERRIEAQADTIERMLAKLRPEEPVTLDEAKEGIITNR